nr:unnamed protein product [Haemonchus contortus]
MFVTLMAAAVIGNAVVMWIIYKHKVMHHGFNYFLFNMAFADLLIAVFNVGTSWTFNLYHDWWYGDICVLTSFFGIAPTTVSVFSMMALSWDRSTDVAAGSNSKASNHIRAKNKDLFFEKLDSQEPKKFIFLLIESLHGTTQDVVVVRAIKYEDDAIPSRSGDVKRRREEYFDKLLDEESYHENRHGG